MEKTPTTEAKEEMRKSWRHIAHSMSWATDEEVEIMEDFWMNQIDEFATTVRKEAVEEERKRILELGPQVHYRAMSKKEEGWNEATELWRSLIEHTKG